MKNTADTVSKKRKYLALLGDLPLRRVKRIVARNGFAFVPCDCDALLHGLNDSHEAFVILDPALIGARQLPAVIAALTRVPRNVVVYAQLTQDGVNGALEIGGATQALVLFQSQEEDLLSLERHIVGVLNPFHARELLSRIEPLVNHLPPALREAVLDMFRPDSTVRTPTALARQAGLTRRSLDRWMARAGFTSTRLVAILPRFLQAMGLLRETTLPYRRVAKIVGYTTSRRLRDHTLELTGLTPAQLRANPAAFDNMVELIVSKVVSGKRALATEMAEE